MTDPVPERGFAKIPVSASLTRENAVPAASLPTTRRLANTWLEVST